MVATNVSAKLSAKLIDARRLVESDEARFALTVNDILLTVTDRRKVSREYPWAVQLWGDDVPPLNYRRDRCLISYGDAIPRSLAYAYGNAAIDTCRAFLDRFGEQSVPEIFNFIASLGRHSQYYTDALRSRYAIPAEPPPLELRKYLIRAYERGEVWQDKPSPVSEDDPWEFNLDRLDLPQPA